MEFILFFTFSILWLFLFSRIGTKLPLTLLIKTFTAGLLAGPIVGFISHTLQSTFLSKKFNDASLEAFFLFFFIVGPIEEIGKFLAVFFTSIKSKHLNSSSAGILLAISAALGFASGENLLYLMHYGIESTYLRLILGNLGHAAFSIFWGYALGVIVSEKSTSHLLVSGLLISAFLHGAYDFFLGFSLWGLIVSLTLAILLFFLLFSWIISEKKRNNKTE